MPGLVLVLEDDLLFGARVEMGLRAAGYHPRFVTKTPHLGEALKAAPVMILVNVGARQLPWPQMVAQAKARRLPPHASIVGYGPHVDIALRQRALDAGCDAFVARSVVAGKLGSLLQRLAWKPDLSALDQELPTGILEGIQQFNQRQFYQCHDTIERVWMDEKGDVRLLYQGILQLGVAFYHVRRGNQRGAFKMLARGSGKLLPFVPTCQGLDIASLLADVERCEATLQELGPNQFTGFDLFPIVRLAGQERSFVDP